MFFRREMADAAAFQEFRECLEASVATDPPIGEDQFRDVGQQLAEITLAAHPELAERIETLKAAQFRALATRSQEWCVRVLKEEVSKADLGGGGGGGGRSFEQRMSAVLSAFMERASGPARDATLVGFCCSGELLQLFGEFDFNVMSAERQAQAAEACRHEQASLKETFAREHEKLRCSLDRERATLERLQGVTLGRTKAGVKELEESQLRLADLDNQLVAQQAERDAAAAATVNAELELQGLAAQLDAVHDALSSQAERASQETADLEAATAELQRKEEVWGREQSQLDAAVADARAVAQASVATLQAKLALATEEKRETQERLVELTLKLAELPTSFQATFFDDDG